MRRYTKKMKNQSIIALAFDFLYILIALIMVSVGFKIMLVPDNITEVLDVTYRYFGFTISSGQLNVILSLLLAYLLVFFSIFVVNFKKVFDKDRSHVEEWDYRNEFLYSGMALFTLNPFSAVVRFIYANEILHSVRYYGFIQATKITWNNFLKLFKKQTYVDIKAKRAKKKELSESQADLELLSRREFFRKIVRLVVTYSFLVLMALFIFIPFYWMILTALKTNHELTEVMNPSIFIKLRDMQWVNFKIALTKFDFGLYMKNTIFVGAVTTVGTVITTILAAFAFSRLEFKGREFIFSLLLLTMMIPGELYTITNFLTISSLGWRNSFTALIVPFMTSVFYIFFLRQAFMQIPDSLYRASKVDGASDFKYLSRVMIPIAAPSILTITILSFIGSWDAYIWPQLAAPDKQYWLISVALRGTSFVSGEGSDARPLYNLQLAATALVTVPLLIIFFLLKKYIVRGVGRSGTKG